MNEYDISRAFDRIEKELMDSIIRNMERHKAEETEEGYEWSMWQTEQLKALEKYKRENKKKYEKKFCDINNQIESLIRDAEVAGSMEQEIEILEAIKKGFHGFAKDSGIMQGAFFQLNERKLEALIKATTDDLQKAETAILRMANDKYRRIIFDAQVYANSGAGTYEKAVDMATRDMAAAGLNCVEYQNGARHRLAEYADMAIRTASKRAYLQGEGAKRQEWGVSTVIMNKRGNPCPKCLPFVGKVLIDDVWSGGKKEDGPYPLMSTAIEAGLYHPRCRDSHTTYFPGISTADNTWTKEELENIGYENAQEAKKQYCNRQDKKYGRLAKYSLDKENKKRYTARSEEWKDKYKKFGFGLDDKYVAKASESVIIKAEITKEVADVHSVGKIDRDIYKCITEDIVTDEVIITDNQMKHILENHPDAYEKVVEYLEKVIKSPDYIIEDKHINTGLIIKRMDTGETHSQMVLRICTSEDEPGYKNSIISCWQISEKRLQNYLRNKRILYKKE